MEVATSPARPSENSLPNAFLNKFNTVENWYRYHPKNGFDVVLEKRAADSGFRERLADILIQQNAAWESPAETMNHIEALRSRNTFAVVTGQQAGIFGGPLYTIYKTITVLKLCKELQNRYPDKQFVPVFWLEVNDSDFEEISVVRYLTKENTLRELKLDEQPDDTFRAIDSREIDASLQDWRSAFEEDFFDTEFKQEAIDAYFNAYAYGGYTDGFARVLHGLFAKHGLILMNPAAEEFSELAQPLYKRALKNNTELITALKQRSEEIRQSGYSPQISIRDDQTLLFYVDEEGRRYRLDVKADGSLAAKDGDHYRTISEEMLLKPGALTPNVALRPVLQDFLLPTVSYVGGPGELSYFAQVEALYSALEIEMPLLYPRHRITLVEKKIGRMAGKLDLQLSDILEPGKAADIIAERGGGKLFKELDDTTQNISKMLEALKQTMVAEDPNLENAFTKTSGSIENNLGKLSANIRRSLEQKNSVQLNQLQKIETNVFPFGKPQERVLTWLYFAVKYGPGLLDELMENLTAETSDEIVVSL